jgi:hypothetical protein
MSLYFPMHRPYKLSYIVCFLFLNDCCDIAIWIPTEEGKPKRSDSDVIQSIFA